MEEKYLSVYDTEKILQISRTTAYALIRSGKIKSYKVGRLVRIKAEDLQRFVESQHTPLAKKTK